MGCALRGNQFEVGAQRIKGLSVGKAVWQKIVGLLSTDAEIRQKKTETSLIERFLYLKYGAGQMWEIVAGLVMKKG
ncbi:unnamed protein product, partial [marine sediment metagenome]